MANEKTKGQKSKKGKVMTIIAIVLVVLVGLEFLLGYFLYSFMLRTDSIISRDTITHMLQSQTGIKAQFFGLNAETIEWYNVHGTDRVLTSADGLTLHGTSFEAENNNHKYAVIYHGYSGRGRQMVGFVQEFLSRGYTVLAPDSRAHGNSEGTKIGMGYFEKEDLLLWLNAIIKADPEAQIVLHGVSMGAATVLMASGEETLPSNVKAVISDCAYTDAYEEFSSQVKDVAHLPKFPLVPLASFYCEHLSGYKLKDASPLEAVKHSETPTLFIHGDADAFVPFPMLDELYNAASCEKEKLAVKDGAHGNSAGTDPELYWSTVDEFLANYIQDDAVNEHAND